MCSAEGGLQGPLPSRPREGGKEAGTLLPNLTVRLLSWRPCLSLGRGCGPHPESFFGFGCTGDRVIPIWCNLFHVERAAQPGWCLHSVSYAVLLVLECFPGTAVGGVRAGPVPTQARVLSLSSVLWISGSTDFFFFLRRISPALSALRTTVVHGGGLSCLSPGPLTRSQGSTMVRAVVITCRLPG